MKAYEMDDESTIYAANSAGEAIALYVLESGEPVDGDYPQELTDAELDAPLIEYDENECPTDRTTTIRSWLNAATKPGFLGGAIR